MVVLAAAIVTKSGKAILSRQFCEIQRSRVEGLLASFPKLTGSGQQNTTIETENVRYVYQPLEELFMVLITNRQSNILQDIKSLHLFARVVTDLCRTCSEHDISRKAFEVLIAFDEIITEGFRENVNLSQVKSNIEMESHEERNQEIIAKNKEQEAKEELKRRAKQFEMQRKEASKRGQEFMQGNFSNGGGYSSSQQISGGGYSPSIDSNSNSSRMQQYNDRQSSYSRSLTPPVVSQAEGMKLGRKAKASDLFEAIKSDVEEQPLLLSRSSSNQIKSTSQEPIHINVGERVSMTANRDGDLEQLDIRGVLTLKISDASNARIRFNINANTDSGIQFKTHPNVDKAAFKNENSVQMKDLSRSFPVNQNLEVVRWKYTTQDEAVVPLSVNCWPSPAGDGTCDVNIEYDLEADLELHDVVISIPLPAGPNVNVAQVDGSYYVDTQRHVLEWRLPVINSSNKSGVLECSVAGDSADGFFPVTVSFTSDKLLCGVDVLDILNLESNSPAKFSKDIALFTDDYVIG